MGVSENILTKPFADLTPRKIKTTRNTARPRSPTNPVNYDSDLKPGNFKRAQTFSRGSFFEKATFGGGIECLRVKDDDEYYSSRPDKENSMLANRQNEYSLAKSHSRDAIKGDKDKLALLGDDIRVKNNLTVESMDDDDDNKTNKTGPSRKGSLPLRSKNLLLSFRDGSNVKDRHKISDKDIVAEDYNEDVQSPVKRKIKFTARDVDDSRFSKIKSEDNED